MHVILERLGVIALIGKAARVHGAHFRHLWVMAQCFAIAPRCSGHIALFFKTRCHGDHGERRALYEFLRFVEGIARIVVTANGGKQSNAPRVRLIGLAVKRNSALHVTQRRCGVAFNFINRCGSEQWLGRIRIEFMASQVRSARFFRTIGLFKQATKMEVPFRAIRIARECLTKRSLRLNETAVFIVAPGLFGQFVAIPPLALRVSHGHREIVAPSLWMSLLEVQRAGSLPLWCGDPGLWRCQNRFPSGYRVRERAQYTSSMQRRVA